MKTRTIEIKQEALRCPGCGSEIDRIIIGRKHTNGYNYEENTFACGRNIVFNPAFMDWEITKECPKTDIELQKIKKALPKLKNYIKNMDIATKYKDSLLSRINYF